MSLPALAILQAVESHALAAGRFDRVNRHEPKKAPGKGMHAAIWVDRIAPYRGSSGLVSTSVVVVLNVRIYTSMLREPQDEIDPEIVDAVDALMTAYSADFDLGVAQVRNVDLLGASGFSLSAQAGYLNQDSRLFRVVTITLPVIVNDVWGQAM